MMRPAALAAVVLAVAAALPAAGGTLDEARARGALRVGWIEDEAPFAMAGTDGQPTGYAVELCEAVAAEAGLPIEYVSLTLADAFAAVAEDRADLVCGGTTHGLARRELVDFSIPTYFGGAGVLLRRDASDRLRAILEGRPMTRLPRGLLFELVAEGGIGVLAGSTTEAAVRERLEALGLGGRVVTVDSHSEGMAELASRRLAAYVGERAVLRELLGDGRPDLVLSDVMLTAEPFGIAVRRDDADFRLLVDTVLSRIFHDTDLERRLRPWFGAESGPMAARLRGTALPD